MSRHGEAVRLLREAITIRQSIPGSKLPLTKPQLTEWSSRDDRWLSIVALYYVAKDYNHNEGEPGIDLEVMGELIKRVQLGFGIGDSEL